MKRILNFGSLNLDTFYTVDHIVRPGETIYALSAEEHCGGKGFNQSVAIKRAGADVFHAGKTGVGGEVFLRFFKELDINSDCVLMTERANGRAIIQRDKEGQNSIVLHPGANREITRTEISTVLQNFKKGDILVAQNEISHMDYLINAAYERGMKIAWNPSPADASVKEIDFSKITWLVINEIEGEDITGEKEPEKMIQVLLEKFPSLKVLLTLGGEGAVYADSEKTFRQKAYPVKTVDTTGAGDTFLGYFIALTAKGKSEEEAVKAATAAAGLAVTTPGAMPSIPDYVTVKKFMEEEKDG